ncbi:MAG TPA: urease accessory protein UreE [Beijerinckiaceae bacterium]|nr:urease accessory protein UreE [Microvirga sp.]HZB37249.1 urease accessory protein UreE [Beijerinckiaceae bacterium]
MLRATAIVRKAAVKSDRVADTVTLDHEGRHRRRVALKGEGGLDFLLDLDKAAVLNDGDAVKLEDGRLVLVEAAPQSLLEIRAENPLRLMRIAWHIGNRHTPAEIAADAIYIEDDHVLAEMVRGQGGTATPVTRPFQPERGAYEHDCGHDHGHPHGHAHDLHHDHGHDHHHDHGHSHDHHVDAERNHREHGPGCGQAHQGHEH